MLFVQCWFGIYGIQVGLGGCSHPRGSSPTLCELPYSLWTQIVCSDSVLWLPPCAVLQRRKGEWNHLRQGWQIPCLVAPSCFRVGIIHFKGPQPFWSQWASPKWPPWKVRPVTKWLVWGALKCWNVPSHDVTATTKGNTRKTLAITVCGGWAWLKCQWKKWASSWNISYDRIAQWKTCREKVQASAELSW